MYFIHEAEDYQISVLVGEDGMDADNDNVDVYVRFPSGEKYVTTFFTLRNVQHLMAKYKATGESGSGLYFYATDMVLVDRLTEATIIETVRDLVAAGDVKHAFHHIAELEWREKPEE